MENAHMGGGRKKAFPRMDKGQGIQTAFWAVHAWLKVRATLVNGEGKKRLFCPCQRQQLMFGRTVGVDKKESLEGHSTKNDRSSTGYSSPSALCILDDYDKTTCSLGAAVLLFLFDWLVVPAY